MPVATVAAILTDSFERIMLTRRNIEPFKGKWCLPGGHIDPDEPVHNAVVREVREETGLHYSPHFFGYFDEIGVGEHAVVLAFYGLGSGTVASADAEVQETAWFTLDEAEKLDLAFRHAEILAAYREFMAGGVRPNR